ncbi:MAG: hypothetical protein LZ172_02805 [Thaumarchaeota archaeon]|jgi:hypothetical protein|nr:hypothetical protein [Candidatus Geocrenenecus arthurdayi]MCL7403263.1 hypothetical protein [Candidatus Geocrenenecus arthurdayi]
MEMSINLTIIVIAGLTMTALLLIPEHTNRDLEYKRRIRENKRRNLDLISRELSRIRKGERKT